MPRSRSRSMSSRNCDDISRFDTVPVRSSRRSASVDFPWSMCAMIEKLRMRAVSRVPPGERAGPYEHRPGSATAGGWTSEQKAVARDRPHRPFDRTDGRLDPAEKLEELVEILHTGRSSHVGLIR